MALLHLFCLFIVLIIYCKSPRGEEIMKVFPNIFNQETNLTEHLKGLVLSATPTEKHYQRDKSITEIQYNRGKAPNIMPSI